MKKLTRSQLFIKNQKQFWTQKSSIIFVIATILVAIPALTILTLLIKYSVNVPWWDQIGFVDLMAKFQHGSVTVYDLWVQHNEHRILVPQVLELLSGKVTGFNFRVPVLLNFVTASATFSILILMLKKTFADRRLVALLAVPFAWLFFSPIQWVDWIWGFQLAFFMSVFFTIITIWLLIRDDLPNQPRIYAIALILASVTTYCNGNGLLIWPIGFGLLLWRRTTRKRLGWWAGVGVVMIGSYLYKFRRSPDSPKLSVVLREPVAVMKYSFAYLGRNLAITPTSARYTGFALLLILAASTWFIYKKGKLDKIMGWLALAAYVALTGFLAAISRLNFGVNHGFISNSYPTISLLFILAIIAIMAYALGLWVRDFNKKSLPVYLAVFVLLGAAIAYPLPAFVTNYASGEANLKALGLHLREVQTCVYSAKSENDPCLLIVFPDKKIAWQNIQTLRQLHWAGFSKPKK